MNLECSGKIWFWKGPAPWYFVTVPAEQCRELKGASGFVTYGWPTSLRPISFRLECP